MAQTAVRTLRNFFEDVGFFWAIFGMLVGMPSIILLVQSLGFERDLLPPLQAIIDGYGQIFAMLGTLVEPWAVPIFRALGDRLGWAYEPNVYWRTVFVIMMLYPIFVVRYHFRQRPWRSIAYAAIISPLILGGSLAFGFVPAYAAFDGALIAGIGVFLMGKMMLMFGIFANNREAARAGLTITSPLVGAFLIVWLAGTTTLT